MIPGMSQMKQLKDVDIDDKELVKIEAIIQSMTKRKTESKHYQRK